MEIYSFKYLCIFVAPAIILLKFKTVFFENKRQYNNKNATSVSFRNQASIRNQILVNLGVTTEKTKHLIVMTHEARHTKLF